MDTTKTITHLSLCTGYEGIGLGLKSIFPNLREIAYVEREGYCCANLVAKIEKGELDAAPIYTDVKTFPYKKFCGKVSIISGGFPCQSFSAIGKRAATDDPRHLFPYIAEGIKQCQPRVCFFENVAGIITAKTENGKSVLQYVLQKLERLGYTATAGIFSASEVGAPHQRKRVYILGMANGQNIGCGRWTRRNTDDKQGFQKQKAQKQSVVWGKIAGCSGDIQWPSRPNQKQHQWEQPRVTKQNKSRLDRAVDGHTSGMDATANRLDRLRLCGNGVVPQTAAKAFLTLINKII